MVQTESSYSLCEGLINGEHYNNSSVVTTKNSITGKRRKQKIDEVDWVTVNSHDAELIRVLPCPYKFDQPEIAEKLIKPFKKAKFNCEVEVDISLAVTTEIPNEKHKHEVIIDVDKSRFPPETDFSEYEYDPTSWFCGLFYSVTPQVKVTLANKKIVEDKETLKLIKKVSNNAVKGSKELAESDEKESNDEKLKNHTLLFNKISEYFQEHLANEIKRVVERLEFEAHLLNDRADERESGISIMLEAEERELRKRLPTAKGRVPLKQQEKYNSEKANFIEYCLEGLTKLETRKKKLNKTQLAEILVEGLKDSNPLQSLRRKLNLFELSFDEILQIYTEQKLT